MTSTLEVPNIALVTWVFYVGFHSLNFLNVFRNKKLTFCIFFCGLLPSIQVPVLAGAANPARPFALVERKIRD